MRPVALLSAWLSLCRPDKYDASDKSEHNYTVTRKITADDLADERAYLIETAKTDPLLREFLEDFEQQPH